VDWAWKSGMGNPFVRWHVVAPYAGSSRKEMSLHRGSIWLERLGVRPTAIDRNQSRRGRSCCGSATSVVLAQDHFAG
jgi:hypothetical protein